jgi:hypothetical protein
LNQCNPPCIPFLGVYLTHLVFTEVGNKDWINGSQEKKLINFEKYYRVSRVIDEVLTFQRLGFTTIKVDLEMHFFLKHVKATSEDDIYNKSLQIEPRETA